MARDFSPITFFLRVPNALLGRYFLEKHGVLQEIAFDELKENKEEAEASLRLFRPCPKTSRGRSKPNAKIEAMAHQAGVTALIEEATDFHQNAASLVKPGQTRGLPVRELPISPRWRYLTFHTLRVKFSRPLMGTVPFCFSRRDLSDDCCDDYDFSGKMNIFPQWT